MSNHSYFVLSVKIMLKNKKSRSLIIWLVVAVIVVAAIVSTVIIESNAAKISKELTVEETQTIVDDTFANIPAVSAIGAKHIIDNTKITVKSFEYGNEKNVIASCEYSTFDIHKAFSENKNSVMAEVYKMYTESQNTGTMINATKIAQNLEGKVEEILSAAEKKNGNITINIYEVEEGEFQLHLSDEMVNECTGGLISIADDVSKIYSVTVDGKEYDIKNKNTLRNGVSLCFKLENYNSDKPDTGTPLLKWWNDFSDEFYRNFIHNAQWKYLTSGLLTTLSITGLSAILGIFIGFVIAVIRCTHQTTGKFLIGDKICQLYLTVFRGTPVMIQLLILFFVFLLPAGVEKFPAAVLCFGLNSGAYVAEIVRGGIMSIDKGQNEAGRSLGFNFTQTMIFIIIPQAFKAILPSLANEFITLLKESSIAFYIGVADLTQGGLKIRSITYSNFMPLIAVALIYLVLVIILTKLVGLLERRLRKSDH